VLTVVVIVLQNCTNLPKVEPDSYNEEYVTSSHFGSEVINIKVEVSDIEEDEGPMPAPFAGIKVEQEASYVSLCPYLSHRLRIVCCLHHICRMIL
jgi:hypothetical protein